MTESRKISRERLEGHPGAVYTETVLKPSYDFMLEHYFEALLETNKAWTLGLLEAGVIEEPVAAGLLSAVTALEADGRAGMGEFDPHVEYFYSTMERYLINHVGEEIAGEINIGRTRPEPLVRLVLRERILEVQDALCALRARLLRMATEHRDTIMPIGTHMQHAQVATLGHYLIGLVNAFERDTRRLSGAYHRTNHCTLGCGALAGSSYPLDRQRIAELLGFEGLVENTNDCVAAGDYMLETAATLANMQMTVSRLCEDFYIWHTQEFGYITIGDDYSGSSSMMPQKKNPYPFEYARTAGAHAVGEMTSAYTTLHNTNYQDTKDVEEGLAPPVFRSLADAVRILRLVEGTLSTVEVDAEATTTQAARHFATCTELAAAIHRSTHLSFRTAHRIVGNLVLKAIKKGLDATQVDAALVNESAREIAGETLAIDDELVRKALRPADFVAAHNIAGGPGADAMKASLGRAEATLDADRRDIADKRMQLDRAREERETRVNRLVSVAG